MLKKHQKTPQQLILYWNSFWIGFHQIAFGSHDTNGQEAAAASTVSFTVNLSVNYLKTLGSIVYWIPWFGLFSTGCK